ncbi:receptor-type tyrosine-protein phosphatase N2-like [Oculina patagonica]
MDSKNLKYILLLLCVILDYGQLRESPAVACFSGADCAIGEYCDRFFRCKREMILDPDYPSYRHINTDDYNPIENDYRQNFDDRDEITPHLRDDSEWNLNDYERNRDDRNLRLPLPIDHNQHDRRVLKKLPVRGGPLPPVVPEEWDKINIGKQGGNTKRPHSDLRQPDREYNQREYGDYDDLKARRHIRHGDNSDAVDSVGNIQDSSQGSKNYFVDEINPHDESTRLRDSSKHNVDSSSKKSYVLHSGENSGMTSMGNENNEKRLPPIPLAGETSSIPDDNSGFQGNHMQTEKEAFAEESSNIKGANSAGEGKVMVKGKVKQVKADIDQGPNPEKTYKRVEDFFQTQRESSIVEVPNAVKKEEASKLFKDNFIPVKDDGSDQVNKEQADSSVHKEGEIQLSLNKKVHDSKVKLKMAQTKYTLEEPGDVAERIKKEPSVKGDVAQNSGLEIMSADYKEDASNTKGHPKRSVEAQQPKYFLITIIVVGCVTGVVLTAVAIYLMMRRYNETKNFKPVTLPGQEAAADYQELCRQLRATQGWDSAPVKTTPVQHGEKEKGLGSGRTPKYSWSEEPVVPNMDISTGHVVLSYMEDHLNNKDRLNKEWEALKTYEAEPNSREIGKLEKNARKNRYSDVLPYDHNRVLMKETASATGSDYINASYVTDHDPKNPSYIATQGPLAHTVSDFWQMVWEQGVVVIVNLTKLSDLGLPQCHRYWPEEQQPIVTYRIYEVHLVSEHIWCEDYLVRSFYLKNLQTSETRTVTQFHFLTWPDLNVPSTPKPLLEFRRKVNKCFRGRASPVVVHCSGGVGRTGTYILIDMVLNKMMRGAKEIDIAATVEHLRDQRPSMVKTKAQFEFALTAVAEEVNAILQALAK